MVMAKIIALLKQYQISDSDSYALENFKSRDGFQVITDDDLEGMMKFFDQYPTDFEGILPIMTDDNSNYLCVYYTGEDKDKVCYLSHDEINLAPKFKSIESLIHIVNENPEAWDFHELPDANLDF